MCLAATSHSFAARRNYPRVYFLKTQHFSCCFSSLYFYYLIIDITINWHSWWVIASQLAHFYQHEINYNYQWFVIACWRYLDLFKICYHYFNFIKSMVTDHLTISPADAIVIKISCSDTVTAFDFDFHSMERTIFNCRSRWYFWIKHVSSYLIVFLWLYRWQELNFYFEIVICLTYSFYFDGILTSIANAVIS